MPDNPDIFAWIGEDITDHGTTGIVTALHSVAGALPMVAMKEKNVRRFTEMLRAAALHKGKRLIRYAAVEVLEQLED